MLTFWIPQKNVFRITGGITTVNDFVGSQFLDAWCDRVVKRSPSDKVDVSFNAWVDGVDALHVDDELSPRIDSHVIPRRVVGIADATDVRDAGFCLLGAV